MQTEQKINVQIEMDYITQCLNDYLATLNQSSRTAVTQMVQTCVNAVMQELIKASNHVEVPIGEKPVQ